MSKSGRICLFIGIIGLLGGFVLWVVKEDHMSLFLSSSTEQNISKSKSKFRSSTLTQSQTYSQEELRKVFDLENTPNTDIFYDSKLGFAFPYTHKDYRKKPYSQVDEVTQLSKNANTNNSRILVVAPNALSYVTQYKENANSDSEVINYDFTKYQKHDALPFLRVFDKPTNLPLKDAIRSMFIPKSYQNTCKVRTSDINSDKKPNTSNGISTETNSIRTAQIYVDKRSISQSQKQNVPEGKWNWLHFCPPRIRTLTDTYTVTFFELKRYPQKLFAFRKGVQTPTPIDFGPRKFPHIIYERDFEKEMKN